MKEYFVHCRITGFESVAAECERQLQVEDNAREFGYKLTYRVHQVNKGYDVFVELPGEIEMMEFKLRCM